jgi:hypothetical protein
VTAPNTAVESCEYTKGDAKHVMAMTNAMRVFFITTSENQKKASTPSHAWRLRQMKFRVREAREKVKAAQLQMQYERIPVVAAHAPMKKLG